MDTNTAGSTEATAPATADTPKTPEIKAVPKISVVAAAAAISAATELPVRESKSNAYRCLVPGADPKTAWKKGLFYQVDRNAKGLNIEMKAYSAKGGAHLAEFNDTFKKLGDIEVAGQKIQVLGLGHAVMLRVVAKDEDGIEKVAEIGKAFVDATLPTVLEVQDKVTIPETKKPGKPAKVKADPKEAGASKKGKAKTKKAPPAAAAVAAAPTVDPSVDAAVADLAAS